MIREASLPQQNREFHAAVEAKDSVLSPASDAGWTPAIFLAIIVGDMLVAIFAHFIKLLAICDDSQSSLFPSAADFGRR